MNFSAFVKLGFLSIEMVNCFPKMCPAQYVSIKHRCFQFRNLEAFDLRTSCTSWSIYHAKHFLSVWSLSGLLVLCPLLPQWHLSRRSSSSVAPCDRTILLYVWINGTSLVSDEVLRVFFISINDSSKCWSLRVRDLILVETETFVAVINHWANTVRLSSILSCSSMISCSVARDPSSALPMVSIREN